ncbi:MAG: NAD(P)-dependent oxidoreductase [Solirubrobacterales bacterium]|nr:NAD(P)-dependent oxidoreductase [Solirubrobacterales bacterium]MBV9473829.1 NAD(P)-dependent oxidoreductase [Solirubrobacterales bacterium]
MRVAVLGLGEAGRAIAADLVAAGASVSGWDPAVVRPPSPQVTLAANAQEAVAGAEAILSVNSGQAAPVLARELASALAPGQLYADLNTAAPRLKAELAAVIEGAGGSFADVALMAPVPGRGLRTPCLASGSGAQEFARRFGALGMPVEVLDGQAGAAAARKLLRSVFMKGLAAAALESVTAARAAGCEQWLHDELAQTLAQADAAMLDRLLTGSCQHASRRVHEMQAAAQMLGELGVQPRVCAAAEQWLMALDANAEVPDAA